MFDYEKIKGELLEYVGDFAEDFDLDDVMDELRDIGTQSIDAVDIDSILQAHDVSSK